MPDTVALNPPTTFEVCSPEQLEELRIILGEECSEVIKEISKVYRFLGDTSNPHDNTTPNERLHDEIGDVLCVISLLVKRGYINQERILQRAKEKTPKVLANLRNKH